jgi:hypothetical protein
MLKRILRSLGSSCLPHDNPKTVCPPGKIPLGPQPPILVSSLMRSGTHLVIDLLLNNLRPYRNEPLYVDFDHFVYDLGDPAELMKAGSCIIKTHVQQRSFDEPTRQRLKQLAAPGLVIIPHRTAHDTHCSLLRLNQRQSEEQLIRDHQHHLEFWADLSPIIVDFQSLLDPTQATLFLQQVRQRLDIPDPATTEATVTAARSDYGVFWDKFQTRLAGPKARVINTTIGYKLTQKSRSEVRHPASGFHAR